MKSIRVLALACSRLQADVIIIRLRRAGIGCGKMSAVFSRRFMPNTVACWLTMRQNLDRGGADEMMLAAGPLQAEVEKAGGSVSACDLVERAGFDHRVAAVAEERLEFGEILLCVHADGEAEAAIAWHIFKHCRADLIAAGGSRVETAAIPAELFAAA